MLWSGRLAGEDDGIAKTTLPSAAQVDGTTVETTGVVAGTPITLTVTSGNWHTLDTLSAKDSAAADVALTEDSAVLTDGNHYIYTYKFDMPESDVAG